MKKRLSLAGIIILLLAMVSVLFTSFGEADDGDQRDPDMEMQHHHHADAMQSMALQNQHNGPHTRWTTLRFQRT